MGEFPWGLPISGHSLARAIARGGCKLVTESLACEYEIHIDLKLLGYIHYMNYVPVSMISSQPTL